MRAALPRRKRLIVLVLGAATSLSAEAVAKLTAEGIGVTELSLRLPSLDEVFFSLTSAKVQEVAA